MTNKKTISILGCGWYGFPLAKALVANHYRVKGSTTSEEKLPELALAKVEPYLIDFDGHFAAYDSDFFNSEILLISIPPKSKLNNLVSFNEKIKIIAKAAAMGGVKQVIFISSTGVYANEGRLLNENVIPKPDSDNGRALFAAEEMLKQNRAFTTTIIRFAGLTGPDRNLAKYFAGRKAIPNGLAPINLIHLNDCIGITQAILNKMAFGLTYHAVAPVHPTRADFYTSACLAAGFQAPEFINELLHWKQIESINVPQFLAYLTYEPLI